MSQNDSLNRSRDVYELVIASPPDREECVVEIWLNNNYQCEIYRKEGDSFQLDIYPQVNSNPWQVDLKDFIRVLEEAMRKL